MRISVGCCGPAGLSLDGYSQLFSLVEVQSSFYRLPRIATAERWRTSVPAEFRFTLKAFQGVTHPASSPTWRRAGTQRPAKWAAQYGHLQRTRPVRQAWQDTLRVAEALRAEVVVVQLPPSFDARATHLERLRTFVGEMSGGIRVAIELRHPSWQAAASRVRELLRAAGVALIVDPLSTSPIDRGDWAYFRLHGLPPARLRYQYSDRDLEAIRARVKTLQVTDAYVLFNNLPMREDTMRFQSLLAMGSLLTSQ